MGGLEATAIFSLLERANSVAPQNGITFYEDNRRESPPHIISYSELYNKAKNNAKILLDTDTVAPGRVLFLHLNSQSEYIEWFWSIVAAGGIPTLSTPLAADPVARERHLRHVDKVLQHPKFITSVKLAEDLSSVNSLDITFIEQLPSGESNGQNNGHTNGHVNGHINGHTNGHIDKTSLSAADPTRPSNGTTAKRQKSSADSELAFLMLTSGSTGNAKAVRCKSGQLAAALKAKSMALASTRSDIFLNWIGFDHVACVTEIHMHAMLLGANQIMVAPALFLQDHCLFFKKLAEHSVTITFAPNFFMAAACKSFEAQMTTKDLDMSKLRHMISGGEANVVSTGLRFVEIIASLGGSRGVLKTAFGMTETLAASHYQFHFPHFEQQAGLQFCSVGQPIHDFKMRITDDEGNVLPTGQSGNVEFSSPNVFDGYYNDPENTKKAFSDDGWFKTGDNGYVTETNHLVLSGRAKDSIIINGVNYFSHELESALEECHIAGLPPSYTAAFSTWPEGSDSEELVIVFLSTSELENDDKLFASTLSEVSQQAGLYCSKRPIDIIPLPTSLLPKSTLGKLSRPKLKKAYEEGQFDDYKNGAKERLNKYRQATRQAPRTETEKVLVELFAEDFGLNKEDIGLADSLTDMGVDSLRVIRFKNLVQDRLKPGEEIPLIALLQNPSIQGLSEILDGMREPPKEYNPIVELQSGLSPAPPIFFFHPGLGEILVFLNLSKYFSDRRVYALRAPGFNPGEEMFKSLDQMTDTYVQHIRSKQQEGPYIFIGYSFGAMISFEVAKKMEASGSRVAFVGTLNLPPHIKFRMVELDWAEVVLNLVYFLGFISEETAHAVSPEYHKLPREEVLARIMEVAPLERLRELDLNEKKIHHWAELSSKLQGLAHHYDPSGSVESMDVFYAVPLIAVGRDKRKWLEDHLLAWDDFVRTPVKFHDVPGSHYTMMNTENVFALQKALRAAMKERGV